MLFNSYIFIFIFFPVTVLGFYLFIYRIKKRAGIIWLVAASWVFYAWWNPPYLLLLLLSIIVNFGFGQILSTRKQTFLSRKTILIIGIIVNLSLLGYFKYANFFVDTVNDLASTSFHLNSIILPLAISFFTFQQIAYLIDASRGKIEDPDFLNYCLFVSFFPQLISGPIVHHKEMMPQFEQQQYANFPTENILIGFAMFSIGLFKKTVLADSMADIADPMFESAALHQGINPFFAWSALLAYAFQIYFDFSAYSDMALGLGRMFGIKLPYNFNSPYQARNIFEFWSRWHMTLSRFMRNHVYLPLVRNRKIKLGHQASLIISVMLGGLWHGANWTFIAWGGLHAIYMLINHGWHQFRRYLGHNLSHHSIIGIVFGVLITFIAGMFTRVFFRADSIDTAINISAAMLGLQQDSITSYALPLTNLAWFSILLVIVWFMPNSQELLSKYAPGVDPQLAVRDPKYLKNKLHTSSLQISLTPGWGIIIGLLFTLGVMSISHTVPFIYFQF